MGYFSRDTILLTLSELLRAPPVTETSYPVWNIVGVRFLAAQAEVRDCARDKWWCKSK